MACLIPNSPTYNLKGQAYTAIEKPTLSTDEWDRKREINQLSDFIMQSTSLDYQRPVDHKSISDISFQSIQFSLVDSDQGIQYSHIGYESDKEKEELWNMLFSEEEMPVPYVGAVKDYAGCLGELLPDDSKLNLEEELENSNL